MIRRFTGLVAAAVVAAALLLGSTGTAAAQDDVSATKHNLSVSQGGTDPTTFDDLADYGEICVYCHTPHSNSTPGSMPLWNRAAPVGPYNMYDNTYSSTMDMTVDASPSGVSLACLSCHDGTIGLDAITNAPNAWSGTVSDSVMPAGLTNLGTDLRNDHPISVLYDNSATGDLAFNDSTSVKTAGLVFYSGKVQCGSCHNPHNNTNAPFLRISNSASTLCTTCHIK